MLDLFSVVGDHLGVHVVEILDLGSILLVLILLVIIEAKLLPDRQVDQHPGEHVHVHDFGIDGIVSLLLLCDLVVQDGQLDDVVDALLHLELSLLGLDSLILDPVQRLCLQLDGNRRWAQLVQQSVIVDHVAGLTLHVSHLIVMGLVTGIPMDRFLNKMVNEMECQVKEEDNIVQGRVGKHLIAK